MTEAETAYSILRAADSAADLSVELRQQMLARLDNDIRDAREAVVPAIDADFEGRAREETLVAELLVTIDAIRYARPRLAR